MLNAFNIFHIFSFNDISWACSLLNIHCHVQEEQYWLICQWRMLSVQQEEPLHPLLLLAVCPPGFFGKQCEEQCDCVHGLSCHHQTGACHCEKGWRGRHCDKRECLLGVYGGKFRSPCTFLPGPDLVTGSFRSRVAPWGRSGSVHRGWVQQIQWRGGSFAPSCLAPAPCPDEDWLHRCSLLARPLWHRLCPAVPVSRGYPLPSPDRRVRLSSGIHRLRLWEK